uniref:Adhesion G-protein coupled receptor G1 n=1 Tax=Pseudonaja textilis TaxID=8673 RepID=A0A670YJP1_PSETE
QVGQTIFQTTKRVDPSDPKSFSFSSFLGCGPGMHGMSSYKENFRFCADRRQMAEGHVRYEIQQDAITISNGADGLNISAPFPPGPQQSWALPTLLGIYRFCVYWFQDDHLFNLTYGISHTYQLSNQANYSFSSLSYTCQGTKLWLMNHKSWVHPSLLAQIYDGFMEWVILVTDELIKTQEVVTGDLWHDVWSEIFPATSIPPIFNRFLHQLESKLGELEFQGDQKSFEGTIMHANVQKVPPQIPENLPIEVTLKVTSRPAKWNTSGCEVVKGEHQTTCLCDHLTFFAVLMVSSPDIDHIHYEYLTIVTYVGCIISALLCTHAHWEQAPLVPLPRCCRQRDHIVYVHMNLLWGIFLLDMSFLIAVPLAPTGGDMACKAGGMFLHFGVLACLTWMAIEGYSLYRLVIEVFNSYVKHLLLKLCLVGWGEWQKLWGNKRVGFDRFGPIYQAAGEYTNSTICWITKKEINNFLNLGYLSLVLFFNSIMLATMVYEILKLRHREHHWEYVVMLLGLSCVLGIPWGLVFFAFASGTFKLVAVYLFTIINSLQGDPLPFQTSACPVSSLKTSRDEALMISEGKTVPLVNCPPC